MQDEVSWANADTKRVREANKSLLVEKERLEEEKMQALKYSIMYFVDNLRLISVAAAQRAQCTQNSHACVTEGY